MKAAYIFVVQGDEHRSAKVEVIAENFAEAQVKANAYLPIPKATLKILHIVDFELIKKHVVNYKGGKVK